LSSDGGANLGERPVDDRFEDRPAAPRPAHRTNTVTVVLAAYNGKRFIRRALGSVLAQTYSPAEVIVVEDGTNDGTRELISAEFPAVHYVWQPNGGPPAAYNAGLALATSEYVACLDQDDAWLPHKLERQLDAFALHPGASIILCQAVGKDPNRPPGSVRELTFRDLFSRRAFEWTDCSMSGWMLRKKFFMSVIERFDTSALSFMDYEALLRVCGLGYGVLVLREELYERDMHVTSFGHSPAGQRVEARTLPAVMRRYAPAGGDWRGTILDAEEYATSLQVSLRRYIGMVLPLGDDPHAREMILEASALEGGRVDVNLEMRFARRFPSIYLAVRRALLRLRA
jgi:glycosyltransferase involved in cell wall biosynthesis